jgi:hypothetical protein
MNELIIVWMGICLWMLVGFAGQAWEWYKHHKALEDIMDGRVPVDYGQMEIAQKNVNDCYTDGDLKSQQDEGFLATETAIIRVRESVAKIRYAGYLIGEQAAHEDDGEMLFINVKKCNPFTVGTGESKQWTRGYCMGGNIADPKYYMDKA